jgi:hypothetical protein
LESWLTDNIAGKQWTSGMQFLRVLGATIEKAIPIKE